MYFLNILKRIFQGKKKLTYSCESESDVTYSQVWWPILGICALQLTHPKCTHTAVNTHTHTVNTHLEQWAAIYAAAPGEQLGVQCLAQGHLSRGIEGGESAVHSVHLQFLPAQDSNSQPFDYESDSLTIRPRLPLISMHLTLPWCFRWLLRFSRWYFFIQYKQIQLAYLEK